MSKGKLKIEDLPTMDDIRRKQDSLLILLSKKFPNPEEIYLQRINITQSFLLQNFGLMELQDRNLIMGSLKKMFQYGFFSFIVPIAVNISLGPMTRNTFFELPKYARFFIRMGIFAGPLYFCFTHNMAIYERVNFYLLDKYMDRAEIFMKFGDPKIMNPNFENEMDE